MTTAALLPAISVPAQSGAAKASPESAKGKVSVLTTTQILPVGAWFRLSLEAESFGNASVYSDLERTRRAKENGTATEESQQSTKDNFEALYVEKESAALLALDPANWKEQDHYSVLGLGRMRWNATAEDIKRAYRRKVLNHHPDKNSGEATNATQTSISENYFKCVQKAYEFMSDPAKRRLYDSVDPEFNDSIPSGPSANAAEFCAKFGPVFARNAHFSTKQPVPLLGNEKAARAAVEKFYAFWCTFDSWRAFDLKLDIPEDIENRDERRYIEKQVKAERTKLKKEEKARILKLVDVAMKHDPRLAAWKESDRLEKEEKRLAKEEATRLAEQQAAQAQQKAAEEAEARQREEQERRAQEKKEREFKKREIRLTRKRMRTVAETLPNKFDALRFLEDLFAKVADDLVKLQELADLMERAQEDPMGALTAKLDGLKVADEKVASAPPKAMPVAEATLAPKEEKRVERPWTEEEAKLIIKAVNLFPGGTKNRWQTIAEYVGQHSRCPVRDSSEIINRVKNTKTPETKFELPSAPVSAPAPVPPAATAATPTEQVKPWSPEEQALLEKALRMHPAQLGPERWSKIAADVGRTKKEVVQRVKELVALSKSGK